MARTVKKTEASVTSTESTTEVAAQNTAENATATKQRRMLTDEQRQRIRDRNARNFKEHRSEIMDYMRITPRNGGDIRKQQQFASLAYQILRNISRLDNVSIVVGDDFTKKIVNVVRNISSVSHKTDEAFSYATNEKEAVVEAAKELEELKVEAIKTLNTLNAKASSIAGKINKINA